VNFENDCALESDHYNGCDCGLRYHEIRDESHDPNVDVVDEN
jgi:hypothetical protein